MNKIRVLIVDDSALVRQVLSAIINAEPDMEVVAACMDPIFAREKIKSLNPDVLTLDVEMPRMDGLTFLDRLMRLRPMPVVMISTLTDAGADTTLKALELGAIDYVSKPKTDIGRGLRDDYANEVVTKIRIAANSKVFARRVINTCDAAKQAPPAFLGLRTTESIIAIGASTGGTEAIKQVLVSMPADAPGIVITQHIPAAFAGPFAKRMNDSSRIKVALADDGQQILPGHAYIAPGDQHLQVVRSGARYLCRVFRGEPVNRHIPSVEVMFDSIADNVGKSAIAVMLTGMGKDGAQAMKRIRETGGRTLAQDEMTSVVWGMPGEAVKIGAAEAQAPLHLISHKILNLVRLHQQTDT